MIATVHSADQSDRNEGCVMHDSRNISGSLSGPHRLCLRIVSAR